MENKKLPVKRSNKSIDDANLYDDGIGPKSQGLGASSPTATKAKNKRLRDSLIDVIKKENGMPDLDKQRRSIEKHLPPGEKNVKSISLRTMINMKIEESLLKNVDTINGAVENYMDNLAREDGDRDVKKHFRDTFLTAEALKEMEKSQSKMMAEHIDFQQFRVWKQGHEIQQQIMAAKRRRIYCMAGRRAGKTEGNILKTVYQIINPNSFVQIIGLTHETAMQLYWHELLRKIEEQGLIIAEKRQQDGIVRLSNGSVVQLMGNSTGDEREKMRGKKWHLVIVDEVQSQKALGYLVKDIIEPTLLDFKGTLVLTGTGPRVRGTLWEAMWENDNSAMRVNWNLTQNPFIPDCETVLEEIKRDKGLTDNDPLFVREYLGKIAYDDDALVMRIRDENFYTAEDFQSWVNQQPPADIRFVGGLDYGFTDSDAFVIFCYSENSPFNWCLYQYKMARQGISELANGIRQGIDFIKNHPALQGVPLHSRSEFYIFGDTSDNRASSDLSAMLGLNIFPAYKHDKTAAIDFLQDDCRRGWLRIPKDPNGMTPLEDEAMKTVFSRDERDNLTREIDDDAYHPDMIPATMYALRSGPWAFRVDNRS